MRRRGQVEGRACGQAGNSGIHVSLVGIPINDECASQRGTGSKYDIDGETKKDMEKNAGGSDRGLDNEKDQ